MSVRPLTSGFSSMTIPSGRSWCSCAVTVRAPCNNAIASVNTSARSGVLVMDAILRLARLRLQMEELVAADAAEAS